MLGGRFEEKRKENGNEFLFRFVSMLNVRTLYIHQFWTLFLLYNKLRTGQPLYLNPQYLFSLSSLLFIVVSMKEMLDNITLHVPKELSNQQQQGTLIDFLQSPTALKFQQH